MGVRPFNNFSMPATDGILLYGLNLNGRFVLITCRVLCASDLMLVGFVCVEVLRPSQPNGVMLSTVSLPNHTFTGQA